MAKGSGGGAGGGGRAGVTRFRFGERLVVTDRVAPGRRPIDIQDDIRMLKGARNTARRRGDTARVKDYEAGIARLQNVLAERRRRQVMQTIPERD